MDLHGSAHSYPVAASRSLGLLQARPTLIKFLFVSPWAAAWRILAFVYALSLSRPPPAPVGVTITTLDSRTVLVFLKIQLVCRIFPAN